MENKSDNLSMFKYYKTGPAFWASMHVRQAIRNKVLRKGKFCENCGISAMLIGNPLHAHHPDYTQPLHIIWLCNICHRRLHAYMSKFVVKNLNLKAEIIRRFGTQSACASALGWHESILSQAINGWIPPLDKQKALAHLLQLKVEDLFPEIENGQGGLT